MVRTGINNTESDGFLLNHCVYNGLLDHRPTAKSLKKIRLITCNRINSHPKVTENEREREIYIYIYYTVYVFTYIYIYIDDCVFINQPLPPEQTSMHFLEATGNWLTSRDAWQATCTTCMYIYIINTCIHTYTYIHTYIHGYPVDFVVLLVLRNP